MKGFTLVEVLISLFLFVIISLSMMQAFNQTTRDQKQIDRIIKENRKLHNTFYAIRKDLQRAWGAPNMSNWMYRAYKQHLDHFEESSYFTSELPDEDRIYFTEQHFEKTGFIGKEESFFFTNLTTGVKENPPVMKTAYTLEDCPLNEDPSTLSKCLVRTTSFLLGGDIDDLHEESKNETKLLGNIQTMKVSYFHFQDNEWKNEFYPTLLKGMFFPHPFPPAVKIDFEFEQNGSRSLVIPIDVSLLSQRIFHEETITLPYAPESKKDTEEEKPEEAPPS